MTDAETTHALLRELIGEVRALRQSVERQGQASSISRTDLHRLATLLPAIYTVKGDEPFTAHELREIGALRGLTKTLSAKSIGRLLRRAEQRTIEDLAVERLGMECNAILWRLVPTLVSEVSRGVETDRAVAKSALLIAYSGLRNAMADG
jgi:hypothetical protein